MLSYNLPLRDFVFLYDDVLDHAGHLKAIGRDDLGADDIVAILSEIGRLTSEVLIPINRSSEEIGCRLEGDSVLVPSELRDAFHLYAQSGWTALTCAVEDGGHGLPYSVGLAVQEIINCGGLAFGDYVGLFNFAYRLLRAHGSEELKSRYLAGLVDGTLGATMCMTEPHCGTDIGLLRTKAIPHSDGTFTISGTKIFISGGDHNLTENIVHLVLARLPDSPPGVKGVSLFAVPKYLPSPDGTLGERNSVFATSLEHKMGYTASATCQMSFDGAKGWLVGERDRGLVCMFTMINAARLAVAGQGLSTAIPAYQNAAAYAAERLQGRAPTQLGERVGSADAIIGHPDVRRMLLTSRAFIESARAANLWLGFLLDLREAQADPAAKADADGLVNLMTPVVKATLSDLGFQACNDCMQVFGGHGYIRETGMEQLVRDARLAQIQEGANGMLAFDVIRRWIVRDRRATLDRWLASVEGDLERARLKESAAGVANALGEALHDLRLATDIVLRDSDRNEAGLAASAVEYQRILGLVMLGWFWVRMAAAADPGDEFGQDKLRTARFFAERVLPSIKGLMAVFQADPQSILEPPAQYFTR